MMAFVAVCANGGLTADSSARQGESQGQDRVGAHGPRAAAADETGIPGWIMVLRERGQARIDNAYNLAARGAMYSGQQELFEVLRMVSHAIDTHHRSTRHTVALNAALQALKEADDFQPSASATRKVELATVLASHQSGILKPEQGAQMTPLMVLQRYYSFAQKKLVEAAHGEPLAAEAMFGLGRIQTLLNDGSSGAAFSEQKTLLFYMAAVDTDAAHHIAANELGVLLSRLGQYRYAQKALELSVASSAEAGNCKNLLAIYERNGEDERANHLRRQLRSRPDLSATSVTSSGPNVPDVAWVSADVLAESGPAGELEAPVMNQAVQVKKPVKTEEAGHPVRRWLDRVKDSVKRD